jgi:hypothetical protein
MLMMTAVIETSLLGEPPKWNVSDHLPSSWLRLWGGNSNEEVGRFVYELAKYNSLELERSTTEILQSIVESEYLVLAGGLLIQNGEVEIIPGCCGGIEDWREWYGIPDGHFPWLGHEPGAWVEKFKDVVRIWGDTESTFHLDIPMQQIDLQLESVRQDMQQFLKCCADWIASSEERQVDGLLEKIAHSFSIDM